MVDDFSFYKQRTLPHFAQEPTKKIPIPEMIGPYKIDSLLSAGGMSVLYLGVHPEKNIPLVIKVLYSDHLQHPDMVTQFLKESEIIALTDHPNIVKLYGQGEWESGLYIAMEFIQGVSLRQFILQSSLSTRRSLEILLQVAYALLHLHTHGVIHRDLKPENILITEAGGVKVIDFGIAQLIYDQEKNHLFEKGGLVGTPSYMSPEQKKDPLRVGYPSDIYSLGIITYEMIIGKLSFGHIQLSLLPKDIQAIVQKCIEPDVEKRYPDIVDFISDVSGYLKTAAHKHNKTEEDDVKFIWDEMDRNHERFLMKKIPNWPTLDIACSQAKADMALSLYRDFFKLSDGTYLVLLGEGDESFLGSMMPSLMVKGMAHALMQTKFNDFDKPFEVIQFVSLLNNMLCTEDVGLPFALIAIHLDPHKDTLSVVSCGYDAMIHMPMGAKEPRLLTEPNPLLGVDPSAEFFETVDSWNIGDSLMMHTFNSSLGTKVDVQNIHSLILSSYVESTDLPSQAKAEKFLSLFFTKMNADSLERSHMVMSLERID